MSIVTLHAVVRSDASVLANLFELYVHDFSEWMPLELKESGRFEIGLGDAWWDAPGHYPFFIRRDGRLVGFALARRGSKFDADPDVMDVAEFFVVRGARRKNVGIAAAHALLDGFSIRWEIRVRESNAAALRFWARVVDARAQPYASSAVETADGTKWNVYRLEPPTNVGDGSAAE